jgi:hypothetical protein
VRELQIAAAERDDARAEADAAAAALREARDRARAEAETSGGRRRDADRAGREVEQLKVSGLAPALRYLDTPNLKLYNLSARAINPKP